MTSYLVCCKSKMLCNGSGQRKNYYIARILYVLVFNITSRLVCIKVPYTYLTCQYFCIYCVRFQQLLWFVYVMHLDRQNAVQSLLPKRFFSFHQKLFSLPIRQYRQLHLCLDFVYRQYQTRIRQYTCRIELIVNKSIK